MQLTAIFILPISRVSTSAILTREGKCTKIDCTYIAYKVLHILYILEAVIPLSTHYLQHQNTKTKNIGLY